MSTGYGWEGLKQVCATLLGARHAERLCGGLDYLGRYNKCSPLPFLAERSAKKGVALWLIADSLDIMVMLIMILMLLMFIITNVKVCPYLLPETSTLSPKL